MQEMFIENEMDLEGVALEALKPEEYIFLQTEQDREAALRWRIANEIRKVSL